MSQTGAVSTGTAVLELARAGRFAEIRDRFAPSLRKLVAAETLEAAWIAEIDRRGAVITVGAPVSESAGPGITMVKIPVTCDNGEFALLVSVVENGQLAGLQIAPVGAAKPIEPWQPPSYADQGTFDEQDVTVGSGALAVPGTLSLPNRTGQVPAVVLLSGSGAHDRDETIGRNKPLKDIAWGLASRGIAVLRHDKVSFAHRVESGRNRDFTLVDEYVTHAIAAVHLLRDHPAVDSSRIHLLGHSLGGTVAPRIAVAEPAVAGLILLAGSVQPMHWSAVRQFRYISDLDPKTADASRPIIEGMTRQAELVDSPELSPSTPDSDLPFNVPAAYWLDLRDYDPPAVAATVDRPILILHGGRDYQVTVEDDLVHWKAALDGRPDVTVRVYDDDNHLFFRGSGQSTPAEYEPAQHVDPEVVADIATWVAAPTGQ